MNSSIGRTPCLWRASRTETCLAKSSLVETPVTSLTHSATTWVTRNEYLSSHMKTGLACSNWFLEVCVCVFFYSPFSTMSWIYLEYWMLKELFLTPHLPCHTSCFTCPSKDRRYIGFLVAGKGSRFCSGCPERRVCEHVVNTSYCKVSYSCSFSSCLSDTAVLRLWRAPLQSDDSLTFKDINMRHCRQVENNPMKLHPAS